MKKYIRADENLEDFVIKGDFFDEYHGNASHVRIPDGVREIGYKAFYGNSTLKSIDLNDVVLVDEKAFYGCENLTTVIGPKVEVLFKSAFNRCIHLEHIDLSSVESLLDGAFKNCKSLVVADLPRVDEISYEAFRGCTALTTVNLPIVEEIEVLGFNNCAALTMVDLPHCRKLDYSAFGYCTALTTVNMPVVKTIGEWAFTNCKNLTEINMPDNVKIKENAFTGTPLGSKLKSKSISHIIPDDQSPEESDIWRDVDQFWDDVEYEQSYVGKVLWAVMDRLKDAGYENPEFDSGGTQRHGEDFIRFTADGTRYEARLDFEDEVEIIWELGVNKSIGSFYDRIIDRAEPIDED